MTPEQEAAAAAAEAAVVLSQAKTVMVIDEAGYQEANAGFVKINGLIKALEAKRTAITGPINASLKLINAMFKQPAEALEQALGYYKRPMIAYQQQLEVARKAAELAATAERVRLENEAKAAAKAVELELIEARRKAQEAAKLAEEANAASDPIAAFFADQQAEEAAAAATQSKLDAEAAVRSLMRVEVPAAYTPKTTAAGSRVNRPWTFKIIDPALVPRKFLMIDEKALGAYVREHKEEAIIPGVEVMQDIRIGAA